MKNEGFNPKKIFWIAALITLVGGIFFFKVKMTFSIGETLIDANLVHVTAITSGILSMISFGYNYLMKGDYSRVLAIIHTIASIGILIGILYLNIKYNSLTASDLPTFQASKDDIAQWLNNNASASDAMDLKVLLAAIWLVLQLVFFAVVGTKAMRSKS